MDDRYCYHHPYHYFSKLKLSHCLKNSLNYSTSISKFSLRASKLLVMFYFKCQA